MNQSDFRTEMRSRECTDGTEAALQYVLANVSAGVKQAFEIGHEYCAKSASQFVASNDAQLGETQLGDQSRRERIRFLAEQIVVECEYRLNNCSAVIETSADQVRQIDFERLLNGPALALVINDLVTPSTAHAMAQALAESKLQSGYENLRDDLSKIGYTLFEAVSSNQPNAVSEYLLRARKFERLLAEITAPFGGSPMQAAAEILNRFGNATRLSLQDSPAFAGLVRIVQGGGEILPHQDDLSEDLPGHPFVEKMLSPGGGQLAGNIYLQVPPAGGELVIWDLHLSSEEIAARQISGSDYGVDPTTLPEPTVIIKPQPGSLILFDSTRMHAVTKPAEGLRVSFSFFIASSPDGIIHYWS